MQKILDNLRSLGTKRLVALGATGVGVVVAIAALTMLALAPNMTTLYAGLPPGEAGKMVSALEKLGVQVRATDDGTTVQVPSQDVARARMALAQQGLPGVTGTGYEIFDADNGLGLTSFMQNVNSRRALEGELSRSILQIEGVDGARVHIVMPERESFSRTAPTPTASVIIRMKGGMPLERSQARGIRHLVASAVPNLKATAVTILDTAGQVILAEGNDGSAADGSDGMKGGLEQRLSRSVEDLLVARLGHGNVRVRVSAELDMKRQVLRSEKFDPKGQVVRSTQTVEEKQRSQEANSDQPTTVQQNLPEAELLNQQQAGGTGNRTDRTEETINYEISKDTLESVQEPGEVRRLSVAVLVNGTYTTAEDGTRQYLPRSKEELDSLTNLVRTAVGFSESRGDTVSVETLQFADAIDAGSGSAFMALLGGSLGDIVKWIAISIIATLLFFLLRPLMQKLSPVLEQVIGVKPLVVAGEAATETLPAPSAADILIDDDDESHPKARSEVEELADAVFDAVDENPDQAVAVIRGWLQEQQA